MKKIFVLYLCFFILVSCKEKPKNFTSEMEQEAKNTILKYLKEHKLPEQTLQTFRSTAQPKPDFSYLYTGGGRCIEFIVNCTNQKCTQLEKYPYDKHGEKCPL